MGADTPEWVESLREQLPVVERCAYLNTGTAGPVSIPAAEAAAAEARKEIEWGRANLATFFDVFERRERVREKVARLLGADRDEIALTHHTSEGINLVLGGIDWRPGDVLVTTNLEHDAGMVPAGLLRQRYGVELRIAEIGRGERAREGIREALAGGARLVLVSHVAYSSGALLPVDAIAGLCREAGALLLVDGAQTCGAMPVDVKELGADFYTLSGQKWICGPEGSGALFVRRDRLERIRPIHASYFSAEHHDFRGQVVLHPSARRFETAMINRPVLAGFEASLDWLLDRVGVERAWQRSLELARGVRQILQALKDVDLVTPAETASHLVSFDLPGYTPAKLHGLALKLADEGIVIRSIDHPPYALRASLGFFNTIAEIERLRDAVARALRLGPEAVPLSGWAARLPDHR